MTIKMPIKKPPRFLPFFSNSKGVDRLFIYHSQSPRVLVEVLSNPSGDQLGEYAADPTAKKLFTKTIKGNSYHGFAIFLDAFLRSDDELEKLAARLQDWFIAYQMKDNTR